MTDINAILRAAAVDMTLRDAAPASDPSFTLLTGGPGSAPARAIGRLMSELGDDVTVVDAADIAAIPGLHADAAAVAMAALHQARERRLHVVAVLPPDDRVAFQVAEEFRTVGYRTRAVIMAGQTAQDLLTVVSAEFRQMSATGLGSFASYDKGWDATRDLAVAATTSDAIGEVLVMSGSGDLLPTSAADMPSMFDTTRARPMSNLQAVAWLGELRRLTEYATSTIRDNSGPAGRAALARLHDLAMERVLPELPIDPAGLVARTQAAALTAQRAELLRLNTATSSEPSVPAQAPTSEARRRGDVGMA